MKHKVVMSDEKLITQGDNDKQLYIIMLGKANVYINLKP